jgi:hypothetical protein
MTTSVTAIQSLIHDITTFSNVLPSSIQQATKHDKIWSVMNTDQCDTAHETFNRRFNAMFGEDCRDSAGHLQHIHKGKFGMGLICSYLSKCDWADGFPLDIVEIKLQQLCAELKYLWYVAIITAIHLFVSDLYLVIWKWIRASRNSCFAVQPQPLS